MTPEDEKAIVERMAGELRSEFYHKIAMFISWDEWLEHAQAAFDVVRDELAKRDLVIEKALQQYNRLCLTMPVDDDFKDVKQDFDIAMEELKQHDR